MLGVFALSMLMSVTIQEAPAPPIPDMGIIREEVEVEEVVDSENTVDVEPHEIVVQCEVFNVPDYPGKKSYMGYNLFGHNTKQYQLQNMAITDANGFRRVTDRYCIAIGSYFNPHIGQYADLVLDNGIVIPCVIGDVKADKDTDDQNIFSHNGCCSEFLVDMAKLKHEVKVSGDVSSLTYEWQPRVRMVVMYELNAFDIERGIYEVSDNF